MWWTYGKVILILDAWEWIYTLWWQPVYVTQTYSVTQQVIYLDLPLCSPHSYHTFILLVFLPLSVSMFSVSFVCGGSILCKTWLTPPKKTKRQKKKQQKSNIFSPDTRIKPNPNLIRPIKPSLWWRRAALLTANHTHTNTWSHTHGTHTHTHTDIAPCQSNHRVGSKKEPQNRGY